MHTNNQDDQQSWQHTRGIGLKLWHEPDPDWKTAVSQKAQELDDKIRRSSFVEHKRVVATEKTTHGATTPEEMHLTVKQNFDELFRNLDIPENVDVQEFEESYLIEFD